MTTHGPASRRSISKPDYGVFDPDKFWGHVLPVPAASTEPDSFDARIERVWRHITTIGFTHEEYERLREVLIELINVEAMAARLAQELSP
jgi:hypothetical protein